MIRVHFFLKPKQKSKNIGLKMLFLEKKKSESPNCFCIEN